MDEQSASLFVAIERNERVAITVQSAKLNRQRQNHDDMIMMISLNEKPEAIHSRNNETNKVIHQMNEGNLQGNPQQSFFSAAAWRHFKDKAKYEISRRNHGNL